jgi:hypothetical protein
MTYSAHAPTHKKTNPTKIFLKIFKKKKTQLLDCPKSKKIIKEPGNCR